VSGDSSEDPYELRTTSTVRRALSESLPEAVAAAAAVARGTDTAADAVALLAGAGPIGEFMQFHGTVPFFLCRHGRA